MDLQQGGRLIEIYGNITLNKTKAMKGLSKLIRYLSKDYGDDIGRGKNKTSKHRQKHTLRARLRRFVNNNLD